MSKTLIGITGDVRYIDRYYNVPKSLLTQALISTSRTGGEYEPIELDVAKGAYKLFLDKFPDMVGVFTRGNIKDNMIELRRKKPSKCHKCLRTHDNNNSYLTVHGESNKCYLGCHSDSARDSPSIYIGEVGDKDVKEEKSTESLRGGVIKKPLGQLKPIDQFETFRHTRVRTLQLPQLT